MLFRRLLSLAVLSLTFTALMPALHAEAVAPANSHFEQTWARPDKPVADGMVSRTWMWGPEAFTNQLQEQYQESPGGQRTVQYFDKSRMEITDPSANQGSVWYVTNGLLATELMTGRMQVGDSSFVDYQPAQVNAAGDADDPSGVTYRFLSFLRDEPASPVGEVINEILTPGAAGNYYLFSNEMAAYGITAGYYVSQTDHTVATPFWNFMNSSGLVFEAGSYYEATIFQDPFFATGYPLTEAYWSEIKVGGVYKDVLIQCFQRRCLTYTPSNSVGWQVEAGNVGQHYYTWRYGEGTTPPADPPSSDPPPTTPDEPSSPVLPEPVFTEAWIYPDAAILAALGDIGIQPNISDPTVRRLRDVVSYRLRGLYNLETASIGSWNHDTTNFYPWLRNRVAEQFGMPTNDGDRSWVGQHVHDQLVQAIHDPESNTGRWIRAFEISFEEEEPGSGPLAYWALLFNPYLHVFPVMPQFENGIWNAFVQVVSDYRAAQYSQPMSYPDFGSYLRAHGIVTPMDLF